MLRMLTIHGEGQLGQYGDTKQGQFRPGCLSSGISYESVVELPISISSSPKWGHGVADISLMTSLVCVDSASAALQSGHSMLRMFEPRLGAEVQGFEAPQRSRWLQSGLRLCKTHRVLQRHLQRCTAMLTEQ